MRLVERRRRVGVRHCRRAAAAHARAALGGGRAAGRPRHLAHLRGGELLAAGGRDGGLRVWDARARAGRPAAKQLTSGWTGRRAADSRAGRRARGGRRRAAARSDGGGASSCGTCALSATRCTVRAARVRPVCGGDGDADRGGGTARLPAHRAPRSSSSPSARSARSTAEAGRHRIVRRARRRAGRGRRSGPSRAAADLVAAGGHRS